MLIDVAQSAVLVVDVQTRLAPAMHEREACIDRCRVLVQAARRLDVPVIASEQYPDGLGPTVEALAALLPPERVFAKRHFAGATDPALGAALRALDRAQIVLCGMEAHVCVLQTALGLKAEGLAPVVVADAVASRRPESKALALARLRAHGVEIVEAEMVLFEWLREAGTPAFKALLPLIK
jgi:nicotinamidase-related amidase